MKRRLRTLAAIGLSVLAVALLVACSDDSVSPEDVTEAVSAAEVAATAVGLLEVRVTDAPPEGVTSIVVTGFAPKV